MPPRPAPLKLIALVALLLLPTGAQASQKVRIVAAPGFVKKYHPGNSAKAPTHADTPKDIHIDLAGQVRTSRLAGMSAFTVSGSQQFLPTTWCGAERTTDDTDNAAQLSDEPFYKVVYAYASDQPDRFNTWKNQLQANVSLIGQFMAQQDGSTKAPRFDMGTSCGPRYLDIQTIALPGTKAAYADNFDAITAAVGARLGAASAKRNVMILADQLTNNGPTSLYGLGQHYNGGSSDIPGAGNPHNNGSLYAALFPPAGYSPPTVSGQQFYPGFWPEGMLHELSHTLGAVNYSAPHTTRAADLTPRGHCTDGYDVMCYADGPNPDPAAVYTNTACPAIAGSAGMTQTYDCHGDDYFNPSPPAGNYLATHWNLYNSIFEASCATIGDACGADSAAVPAGVAAPRLTGTAKVNNVLSADRGTWSGTPTSFAYQWQRTPSGGSTTDIPGATDATYTLTPADAQAQIQAKVTATNTNGSASNTSSQTTIAAYNPPVNTAPPAITGTARRGRVLTASTGGWTGSTSKGFKWQRLVGATWTDIAGQTASTYTLASADVDTSVRVLETATNADGPASAASNAIGPVSPALPIVQTAPGISGTVQRTRTLTASNGTWSDAPTAYGYQWQRDGVDIGGATAQTYVPVQNDVGATLRVLVTATNADGDSAPAESAQTAAVADLQPPVGSTQPAITGEPTNTHALSADHGTWSNSPTSYAYQWQRDSGAGFGNIQDATQAGYVLTAEDVEALVRVRIVATNGDGDSAAAYSAPVGPVADVPVPVNGARPQVSGTSKAGHSVTATSGDWTHDPTSFAFQWQRSTGGAFDDIGGATGTTYALGLSDVGHSVRVVVVASNADGDSAPAESDPTAAVAAVDPVQLPPIAPVIAPVDLTPVGPGDLPTVPVAPADVYKSVKVSLKRGKRTTLKLTVTSRTSRTGLVATIPSKWVKVAKRGTYRLTLCANVVCVSKPFRAARGKAKLPAIVAASQIPGRVTLRLIGPGGRATGKLP